MHSKFTDIHPNAKIGENVEIGCSSVLNPGVVIFENTHIPPLSNVKGIMKGKEKCVE